MERCVANPLLVDALVSIRGVAEEGGRDSIGLGMLTLNYDVYYLHAILPGIFPCLVALVMQILPYLPCRFLNKTAVARIR